MLTSSCSHNATHLLAHTMWCIVRSWNGLVLIGLSYGRGLQVYIVLRENCNGVSLSTAFLNVNSFWSFFPNRGRKEHICKVSSCLPYAYDHITILSQRHQIRHSCDQPSEWLGLPVGFLAHTSPLLSCLNPSFLLGAYYNMTLCRTAFVHCFSPSLQRDSRFPMAAGTLSVSVLCHAFSSWDKAWHTLGIQ